MGEEIITFGNIEVEKCKFHKYKNPVSIYGENIDGKYLINNVNIYRHV